MHQKSAAAFQSRKKPMPDDLKQDIDDANGELVRINVQIAQKHKDIEATKLHFDQEKQRFHELKSVSGTKVAPPK